VVDEFLDQCYCYDNRKAENDDENDFENNQIRSLIGDTYPEWMTLPVCSTTCGTARPGFSTKILSRYNAANGSSFIQMFRGCTLSNTDLSRWNVANATDFNSIFEFCCSFDADLSR
jgi:surface protein